MFLQTAIGEATPGASVQKPTPAASRQDVFAGVYIHRHSLHIHMLGLMYDSAKCTGRRIFQCISVLCGLTYTYTGILLFPSLCVSLCPCCPPATHTHIHSLSPPPPTHLSEQLAAIPEFSKLGPLFKSADKPVELTESETEYVVRCIKHTFANHIIFQVSSHWSMESHDRH